MTPRQLTPEKPTPPVRERPTVRVRRRRPNARAAIALVALGSLVVPGIVALVVASLSAF